MARTPAFTLKRSPKNLKRSIHGKYRRRLRNLAHVANDFLDAAKRKLDRRRSGRIKHRAKIEMIVQECEKLVELLPGPPELRRSAVTIDLAEILGLTATKEKGNARLPPMSSRRRKL
jgi:hypothetical protein